MKNVLTAIRVAKSFTYHTKYKRRKHLTWRIIWNECRLVPKFRKQKHAIHISCMCSVSKETGRWLTRLRRMRVLHGCHLTPPTLRLPSAGKLGSGVVFGEEASLDRQTARWMRFKEGWAGEGFKLKRGFVVLPVLRHAYSTIFMVTSLPSLSFFLFHLIYFGPCFSLGNLQQWTIYSQVELCSWRRKEERHSVVKTGSFFCLFIQCCQIYFCFHWRRRQAGG